MNGQYGDAAWTPIRYVNRSHSRTVLAGLYRAADVAMVTPLRDGMNLVAKEYLAAQDPDDPGVLVLSQFAGAAKELTGALIVNPHESDAVAAALKRALGDAARGTPRAPWTDARTSLENDVRKMGGGLSRDTRRRRPDPPSARGHTRSIRGDFGKWAVGIPLGIVARGRPNGFQYFWIPTHCCSNSARQRRSPRVARAQFPAIWVSVKSSSAAAAHSLRWAAGARAGDRHDMRRLGERPGDGQVAGFSSHDLARARTRRVGRDCAAS